MCTFSIDCFTPNHNGRQREGDTRSADKTFKWILIDEEISLTIQWMRYSIETKKNQWTSREWIKWTKDRKKMAFQWMFKNYCQTVSNEWCWINTRRNSELKMHFNWCDKYCNHSAVVFRMKMNRRNLRLPWHAEKWCVLCPFECNSFGLICACDKSIAIDGGNDNKQRWKKM